MKNIALEASAGSGKTFTLSVRYLALILSGVSINEIVALTFTKKAVNEMKERISKVFLDLENRANELKELSEILKLNKAEILKKRDALRQDFLEDELRIYTFDSFFAKILRLFATHEGLSVDYELNDNLPLEQAFLDSLKSDEALDIVRYLKKFQMSVDEFCSWLYSLYLNYTGKYSLEIKEVDAYKEFCECKADLMSFNNTYVKKWCLAINDLESLLNSGLLNSSSKTIQNLLNEPLFAAAFTRLLSAVAKHYANNEAALLKLCFDYLEKFSQVAKKYHQDNNILSFSDVALYVYKIMQNNELKDLFYFRLNTNLSHLLIDEFQDTSIIQYEIIKPIVEEIVAGFGIKDNAKSFFYVGDKKQSIYTFRGANQEVFDLFHKNDALNINLEKLNTNYRSKKAIVDFVNTNFTKVYQGIYTEQIPFNEVGGKVSKIDVEDDYLDKLYLKIASLIKDGAALEDICILTRKNDEVEIITNYLQEKGVLINSNNSVLLINKPSVRVLIEFAKYCIFKDEAYKVFVNSVLNKDYESIKIDITKNAYEIYNDIISHLNIKKDEYILEFLDDISNAKNFLSTLYEMSQKSLISSNQNGLNIMTVHKSKGLQFKHLIVMHISKPNALPKTNKPYIEYDFKTSSWYGLRVPKAAIFNIRYEYDLDYKAKYDRLKDTLEFDNINVHYVAYTRAIESLCIIKKNDCGLSGIDYESIDDENLDENLMEFKIGISNEIKELKEYEFLANIPMQEKVAKSFSSDAIMLGNAFHYFCELSDFMQDSFNDCFKIASDKFYKVDKNKLEKLCKKLLDCKDFLSLINGAKLLKECNYYRNNKEHRIDLVAFKEDEVLVIDYKSSIFAKPYEKQLLEYKSFLESKYKNVKAFVVFYENEDFKIKEIIPN